MSEIEKTISSFKSFDGTEIHYEVRGNSEGPPIVMAYGIGCLINHWQKQIKYFSKNYKTIVFDYRGHHNSSTPEDKEQLTIRSISLDIQALLEHLDVPSASFWSHSFGSQILLDAYTVFPEKFDNLVFINGFATNPLQQLFQNKWAQMGFELLRQGHDHYPEPIKKTWRVLMNHPITQQISALTGGFNLQLTSLKDIEIYTRGVGAMDVGTFTHLFEQMLEFDGEDILEKISVPTLIIGGKKDRITPGSHQELLHQKIAGSELSMVPFGTHCTQLDMSEFVNLRIEKFLQDQTIQ